MSDGDLSACGNTQAPTPSRIAGCRVNTTTEQNIVGCTTEQNIVQYLQIWWGFLLSLSNCGVFQSIDCACEHISDAGLASYSMYTTGKSPSFVSVPTKSNDLWSYISVAVLADQQKRPCSTKFVVLYRGGSYWAALAVDVRQSQPGLATTVVIEKAIMGDLTVWRGQHHCKPLHVEAVSLFGSLLAPAQPNSVSMIADAFVSCT